MYGVYRLHIYNKNEQNVYAVYLLMVYMTEIQHNF